MGGEIILYHGSKEIVEFPEIRMARYNTHQISFHTARALATLKFVRGYDVNAEA